MAQKKGGIKSVLNILKTEWSVLGSRKRVFVTFMSFFVLANAIHLLTPYVVGSVFNSIQQTISSDRELFILMLKISSLLLLTILFWVFHGTGRVMEGMTGFHVNRNFVNEKMRRILKLPTKWHKDNHSGDTIDKVNKSSSSLSEFSKYTTFQLVSSLVSFIGSLLILFFIDWRIGIFATVFSFVIMFVISAVDKVLNKKYERINKYENKFAASIYDYLSNVITVITLRLQRVVLREVDRRLMASHNVYKQSIWINEVKWAFASICIQVMIVVALIYRSYNEFHATGTILIGTLYMLYSYLTNVGYTFYSFAELYGRLIRINAGIENVSPIDKAYEKLVSNEDSVLPLDWEEIALRNASFSYDKKGEIVHLNDANFSFQRGQKIALVGESGSGKSTILSLIRGLYDLERGEILCDGVRLRNGVHGLKENVTLIPQDPEIFNDTFRYNITLGLTSSKEEINRVISMAQLKGVLKGLPKGLNTNIMEKGVSLSGGEKQRLALARGLLFAKDSDILLLDEPTSSVDSMNEIKIHEHLFKEFKDKTIISSIHRLHLLDKFDYIYLFSKGKIVGRGTFEELKKNHRFDKIWRKYNQEKLSDKRLLLKEDKE